MLGKLISILKYDSWVDKELVQTSLTRNKSASNKVLKAFFFFLLKFYFCYTTFQLHSLLNPVCQHLPNCTRVIKMPKTREFHPPISWNHTWKTSATICFVSPVDLRVLWVPCLYIIMFVAQVSWTKCVTIQKHTFCQAFLKALSWQKTVNIVLVKSHLDS